MSMKLEHGVFHPAAPEHLLDLRRWSEIYEIEHTGYVPYRLLQRKGTRWDANLLLCPFDVLLTNKLVTEIKREETYSMRCDVCGRKKKHGNEGSSCSGIFWCCLKCSFDLLKELHKARQSATTIVGVDLLRAHERNLAISLELGTAQELKEKLIDDWTRGHYSDANIFDEEAYQHGEYE